MGGGAQRLTHGPPPPKAVRVALSHPGGGVSLYAATPREASGGGGPPPIKLIFRHPPHRAICKCLSSGLSSCLLRYTGISYIGPKCEYNAVVLERACPAFRPQGGIYLKRCVRWPLPFISARISDLVSVLSAHMGSPFLCSSSAGRVRALRGELLCEQHLSGAFRLLLEM